MKILITGANGMLGTAMQNLLNEKKIDYLPTDINTGDNITVLDIRDYDQCLKITNQYKPDFIFHFAAETNVDFCEQDVKHSYRTNSIGTENIVKICDTLQITLIYISTSSVFDGKKRDPYTEFDDPNPINYYAKAKYEGEKFVEKTLNKYYIFRAGWMIGGGKKDKKFVAKMLELMQNKDQVQVVNDKIGTPTFTFDFASGILKMIKTERYGLYHMANKGVTTRYEIAKKIKEIMNFDCEILPVNSAYFPLPAERPDSEAIINYKFELLGDNFMPLWQESLIKYLNLI